MLKFLKKKTKEVVSVKDYLRLLKRGPVSSDSWEFVKTKAWVDSQVVPQLPKLVSRPVEFTVTVPTYEEYLEEWFSGRWQMVKEDYYLDKGYLYFGFVLGLDHTDAPVIVYLIVQVLAYYGYEVSWKSSGQNVIFTVSLP